MREEVSTFLDAKMSKSFAEQRIQGATQQPSGGYSNYSGPAPMHLDAMTSGKGKGGFQGNCYNCGQPGYSARYCPKGKCKSSGKGKSGGKLWMSYGKGKNNFASSPPSIYSGGKLVPFGGKSKSGKFGGKSGGKSATETGWHLAEARRRQCLEAAQAWR